MRSLALLLLPLLVAGQLSKPVAHDDNVDTSGNKFLQRQAHRDVLAQSGQPAIRDEVLEDICPMNIALKWHTEISSSIYATPLITDLYSDGRKDIVVPGFAHRIEVVEGQGGARLQEFEGVHRSTAHTSPLLYDIDADGVADILLATYDGEVMFFKDTGDELPGRLIVPRLRVRRDWFVGLAPDHVDHSNPDVKDSGPDAQSQQQPAGQQQGQQQQQGGAQQQRRRRLMQVQDAQQQQQQASAQQGAQQQQQEGAAQGVQQQAAGADQAQAQQQQQQQAQQGVVADQAQAQHVQQAQQPQGQGQQQQGQQQQGQQQVAQVEQQEQITQEAADSYHELFDGSSDAAGEGEDTVLQIDAGGDQQGQEQQQPPLPPDDSEPEKRRRFGHVGQQERPHGMDADEIQRRFADYEFDLASRVNLVNSRWQDEDWRAPPHTDKPHSTHIYVDAHILATPVIGDLDGDGAEELVVAASYFFDRHYYDKPEHRAELGSDVDLGRYLATGIVVFDLHRRTIRWDQHLDLSTDMTQYKAYARSAPTLADLDNDGKLEIIVGTSMGFLYVLDGVTGQAKDGWPMQMGDIQGQVAVGDINGDGLLEVIAADERGSVAAFGPQAKEVWERHLASGISTGITLGDVDGDGRLDVILGTLNGEIFVLDGPSGRDLPNFPFRGFGRFMAPVLPTKLSPPGVPGLHLAALAFDGFLYVIDGRSGCADTLDIGETSYSMVLADDLDGNGKLDLLVSTMNGNLYCIATQTKHHPLLAWPQQVPGGNGFAARWGWEGVHATSDSRLPRDVQGQFLPIRFTVLDKRPPLPNATLEARGIKKGSGRGPYKVSVMLTGVGVREMNRGESPVIGMADVVNTSGGYTLEVPTPRTRSTATIRVEMRDEHRLVFSDEFALSFHMHFYRLLKWLLAAPFLAAAIALLALPGPEAQALEQLPSFSEGALAGVLGSGPVASGII